MDPLEILRLEKLLPDSKWGVFGGAFDPPHFGHLIMAIDICEQAKLDGVLFLPTPAPPHKEAPNADFETRLNMIEAMLVDIPCFVASDFENRLSAPNYTVDTISALQQKFPKVEFKIIVGGDNLSILNSWRNIDRLLEISEILVGSRPGSPDDNQLDQALTNRFRRYKSAEIDISSTQLRERRKNNLPLKFRTSDAVIKIIEENELYK
ncbi:MAG: nicotinate (nicotinamide) nucleotide adenylyltransferase [candidate division Zixibacteria bacterium]|nr:nicotinate (nicotinamide) nucleotide adenylyltransferase [candidate division Zixibacteria bacterium]